jgi:hypothetical protein
MPLHVVRRSNRLLSGFEVAEGLLQRLQRGLVQLAIAGHHPYIQRGRAMAPKGNIGPCSPWLPQPFAG